MKMSCVHAFVACALLASGASFGQSFPSKLVRLIVPYPPGGGADFTTRVFGNVLAASLGQQFIIENRPGANGNLGSEVVARAQPNGYTILGVANTTVTVNPSLYTKMPIDMIRDLAPISIMASQPNVLIVHPSLPVRSVKELVEMARKRPGQLDYGSAGTGSSSHIAAELFRMISKADMTHIPYKGNGPAMTGLLGGEVGVMFNNLAPSMPQVRNGRLRALAVTGEKRSAVAPELPTMGEDGYPGVIFTLWVGLLAPSGTPSDIIDRLSAETAKGAQIPDVRERLRSEGAESFTTSPAQMAGIIREETARWAQVVKAAKILPQ